MYIIGILLQYILLIHTGVVVTGNRGFPPRLPATVWMSALSIPTAALTGYHHCLVSV